MQVVTGAVGVCVQLHRVGYPWGALSSSCGEYVFAWLERIELECCIADAVQDVLFESKLANMCLKPKIIDDQYLKPEEHELLKRHLNEYSMSSPPVFTHMYDSVCA